MEEGVNPNPPPTAAQAADWYLSGQLFANPSELLQQLLGEYRVLENALLKIAEQGGTHPPLSLIETRRLARRALGREAPKGAAEAVVEFERSVSDAIKSAAQMRAQETPSLLSAEKLFDPSVKPPVEKNKRGFPKAPYTPAGARDERDMFIVVKTTAWDLGYMLPGDGGGRRAVLMYDARDHTYELVCVEES